ncbi:MAG: hypothetical protein ABI823_16530 [Bryobacteraceae bacterium]
MLHRMLTGLAFAGILCAADPWIGVWKMNYAKTQFPGEPPKDVVLTYEAQQKGLRFTSSGRLPGGSAYSYQYVASVDGKDYPVTGHATFQTVSLTWRDGKLEIRFKREGREVVRHATSFSADGKVMTTTSNWQNPGEKPYKTVGYFDKQ